MRSAIQLVIPGQHSSVQCVLGWLWIGVVARKGSTESAQNSEVDFALQWYSALQRMAAFR